MEINIFHVFLKKAMMGLMTLVITLGEQVRPNTSTCHSRSSPSHLNRKNFCSLYALEYAEGVETPVEIMVGREEFFSSLAVKQGRLG